MDHRSDRDKNLPRVWKKKEEEDRPGKTPEPGQRISYSLLPWTHWDRRRPRSGSQREGWAGGWTWPVSCWRSRKKNQSSGFVPILFFFFSCIVAHFYTLVMWLVVQTSLTWNQSMAQKACDLWFRPHPVRYLYCDWSLPPTSGHLSFWTRMQMILMKKIKFTWRRGKRRRCFWTDRWWWEKVIGQ